MIKPWLVAFAVVVVVVASTVHAHDSWQTAASKKSLIALVEVEACCHWSAELVMDEKK